MIVHVACAALSSQHSPILTVVHCVVSTLADEGWHASQIMGLNMGYGADGVMEY